MGQNCCRKEFLSKLDVIVDNQAVLLLLGMMVSAAWDSHGCSNTAALVLAVARRECGPDGG